MEEMNSALRQMTEGKKTIRFSIKCDDTAENQAVHDAFKEFARTECDNNYTMAIRKMLEALQEDWKYESLSIRISNLESATPSAKATEVKEKEDVKAF